MVMQKKILIFKPKSKGKLKKSAIYSIAMFAKTLALCTKYLFNSLKDNVGISMADEYLKIFWRLHFQSSFTSLYVTGKHYLQPEETYIFMSNHESWMDIPAIFGAVPSSLRMVSKASLMKIPVFGHAMHNAGFVAIDRSNRTLAVKQLEVAKKRLKEGISIWIAPEGTRTRNGSIGPFKKGGFYLAKELKTSIVPVFIEGAGSVMPPDSMVIRTNQSITVHFCEPILSKNLETMSTNELVEQVRAAIIEKQRQCLSLKGK
jgi:1-acyl-sn-glycerol-3-phosphate acyltransferase